MNTLAQVASEIELANARILRNAAEMMLGIVALFKDQQAIIADQERQIADLKKNNVRICLSDDLKAKTREIDVDKFTELFKENLSEAISKLIHEELTQKGA